MGLSKWRADCDGVFAKISRQLEQREELCSRLAGSHIKLAELVLAADAEPQVSQTKLLTLLDCVEGLGKVPARKLLGEKQNLKVAQFSRQELQQLMDDLEDRLG